MRKYQNISFLICIACIDMLSKGIDIVVIQRSSLRIERRSSVGITQQRLDGDENSAYVVNARPFVLQNVQTDVTACLVYVGMIALCDKRHCWRFHRIVLREERKKRINEWMNE